MKKMTDKEVCDMVSRVESEKGSDKDKQGVHRYVRQIEIWKLNQKMNTERIALSEKV